MGGVDLLDSLIDLYHKKIGKKNGIIASYSTSKISFIIVQAWLLYRSDYRGTGVPAKEQVALCDFKLQIAECLSIQSYK